MAPLHFGTEPRMGYTVKEIYWKRPTPLAVVSFGSTTPSSVSLHSRALPAEQRKEILRERQDSLCGRGGGGGTKNGGGY